MDKKDNYGELCTPVMEGTEEPPHIQFCDNLYDTLMGVFKIGNIIEGKNHACNKLETKEKKGNATRIVPDLILMSGNKLMLSKPL